MGLHTSVGPSQHHDGDASPCAHARVDRSATESQGRAQDNPKKEFSGDQIFHLS